MGVVIAAQAGCVNGTGGMWNTATNASRSSRSPSTRSLPPDRVDRVELARQQLMQGEIGL
jgi:hypothetical protein